MTIKEIENLIAAKVSALKLFAVVANLAAAEWRVAELSGYPAALVGFVSDAATEVRSRLVVEETYQVAVVAKKQGGNAGRDIHVLCDAVRDAIHGKVDTAPDITPFMYTGREIVEADGQVIVCDLRFRTTHALHVPTLT